MTNYEVKSFEFLKEGIDGISAKTLTLHLSLYQGYVTNVNKLTEKLAVLRQEKKTNEAEYTELQRRFGWEWNGMRLHEYYFECLSKTPAPLKEESALFVGIKKSFENYEAWENDFKALALSRGIGWVALCYDQEKDMLFNVWINEHHIGHLAGLPVVLIIDVFEHAFMLDYETKRADYISAFLRVLDWSVMEKRFINATKGE